MNIRRMLVVKKFSCWERPTCEQIFGYYPPKYPQVEIAFCLLGLSSSMSQTGGSLLIMTMNLVSRYHHGHGQPHMAKISPAAFFDKLGSAGESAMASSSAWL